MADRMGEPNVKIDVIFVGQTGVGKSSLINMIRGIPDGAKAAAKVSNDAHPCTAGAETYPTSLGEGLDCQLWDTRGLDEAAGSQSSSWRKAKLMDIIRQLISQQGRELRETLRGRIKVAKLILVWCIDATKIDVDVHWRQFKRVFVEYCEKNATPVVVITRGTPNQADWETRCTTQLQQLDLGVDVRCIMVRKYRIPPSLNELPSSPEYAADSDALKGLISELMRPSQ